MTKFVLPVRHYVKAKHGRNRSQKMLKVTEGVAFEIPDYSSAGAPVVASLNKPWPVSGLPGQWDAREANDDRFNNGISDIRHRDGVFYAPMKRFSTIENRSPEKITVDDLSSIDNTRYRFASAFDNHLGYDVSPSEYPEGRIFCEGDEGVSGDWETLKVRDIDPVHDHRAKTIRQTAEHLKFALIDGDLYLRLDDEPRIRYINFPNEVFITIEQNDLLPPKLSGFFRLDRMDDCLEHVTEAYPGKPVSTWVRNLKVHDENVFSLKPEEMALKAAAWEVGQAMGRVGRLLNENPDPARLYFRLEKMRLENASQDELDSAADILSDLTKHDLSKFGIRNQEIEAAVNRWQIRPVTRNLTL